MDFRARMSRDMPKEGRTHVVFSIKTCRGNRMEIDGDYEETEILKLWTAICGLNKNSKE